VREAILEDRKRAIHDIGVLSHAATSVSGMLSSGQQEHGAACLPSALGLRARRRPTSAPSPPAILGMLYNRSDNRLRETPNRSRPKKARHVQNNVKSMFICFWGGGGAKTLCTYHFVPPYRPLIATSISLFRGS
jgi:hypothetical protein